MDTHIRQFPVLFPVVVTGVFFCLSGPLAWAQERFVIPETWAHALDARDEASPGFQGRIVQARANSGLTATVARGNAHLRGALIDPETEEAYVNVIATDANKPANWAGETPVAADGSFVIEGAVNFSTDATGLVVEDGNFSDDAAFTGIPGANDDNLGSFDNAQNFSMELNTLLELPEGEIILGVRHDDAVEVAFHPNDARDLFRQRAVGFDSNSGKTDRTVLLDVPVAGLYSMRVLLAQWTADATLELYTADPADPGDLTLINDPAAAAGIKAWRPQDEAAAARPYIASVTPGINATGVDRESAISVRFEHLGDVVPEMQMQGEPVAVTTTEDGTASVVTHQPETPFEAGQSVRVSVRYGEAVAEWTFVSKSGNKALLITGGGQLNGADGWVANRLASTFGLDVTVKADDAVALADADEALLIFNSSTVNSGNVADDNFETLPIPIINVEGGNVDDFQLADAPFSWGNGPAGGFDTVVITEESHPISAGFDPGEHVWSTANVQYHWGQAPVNAIVIGEAPNNPENKIIYALEEGTEILDDLGEQVLFTHPARRVFFGMTGNDGAASYTELGVRLFDAVVNWVLGKPVAADATPVITGIEVGDDVRLEFTKLEAERTYVLYRASTLQDWQEVSEASLEDAGDLLRFSAPASGGREQFRIGVFPPPPLLFEDFESGASGWEAEVQSGETHWELGAPDVPGLNQAHGGANVYGTNLDGEYGSLDSATLTSPVIDLTDVRRAKLRFWYYVDTTENQEGVQLRFLGENGQELTVRQDIFWGQSDGWVEFNETLPIEAQGLKIRLQWALLTDDAEPNGTGFYLDDVLVDS